MRVFRLSKARWAASAWSGEGALRYPGRWNFAGTPMVYTATSRALAVMEMLVHLEIRHAPHFMLCCARLPDELIEILEEPHPGWNALPASDVSRRIGNDWARSRASVGLQVPSVVVPGEHNVLLNPLHPDFARLEPEEPEPFVFDPRLG